MGPGMFNLAENLINYNVNGWDVISEVNNKPSTGGHFSVGYNVRNQSGVLGFLKALDYSRALSSPNSAIELQAMTTAYNFERELLEKCRNNNLRHVVRIIDAGHFDLPPEKYPAGVAYATAVDYIVLERADCSVRNVIDLSKTLDYAWALRSLHNVAVGINEMHGMQVAHQDIKPSNILLFEERNTSKLGDVGRSSALDMPISHDNCKWAGDRNYSPFEQLYGVTHPDWKIRRYSCDMFMFGNLVMTYFNNISITNAVLNKLPQNLHPVVAPPYEFVLPMIQKAFSECLEQFSEDIDSDLRKELVSMVSQLCNPDLDKRGDLKNAHLGAQQYSLERYISRLDYLAKKYEHSLKSSGMKSSS